jgi:UDP-N-acetyl-D-galactosamine dehydrogenase
MAMSSGFIVAVVGLGYVGLPLAVEFGKQRRTIGYDLSEEKISAYRSHLDPAGEVSSENLKAAALLEFYTDPCRIGEADFIIIAVPTPVDATHSPDFEPLLASSTTVGKYMKRGAVVVYESTVYPGATEEICVPILERESGFKWKKDFHIAYSPERVNPGDKEHTITKIVKVVSGDDEPTSQVVSDLYESIITAGVYRAGSIKVAEAAKVIENTQRDLNIALMNELAIIFDRLGIDTVEVLRAAGTKWNFLNFRPGLVGGHCIGVDPYYLTHKAEMVGYHPQVILAGRRINDGMAAFLAQQTIKQMIDAGNAIKGARVVVLGLTFKENCPDLRNSKVAELVRELKDYGCKVFVHDPIAEPAEAKREYGIDLVSWGSLPQADAVVAAVAHQEYLDMPPRWITALIRTGGVFVDVKSAHSKDDFLNEGIRVWRL